MVIFSTEVENSANRSGKCCWASFNQFSGQLINICDLFGVHFLYWFADQWLVNWFLVKRRIALCRCIFFYCFYTGVCGHILRLWIYSYFPSYVDVEVIKKTTNPLFGQLWGYLFLAEYIPVILLDLELRKGFMVGQKPSIKVQHYTSRKK